LGGRPSTRKFAHSPKLLKVQISGPVSFAVDADSQSKIEIDLEGIFPMPFLDNFRVADNIPTEAESHSVISTFIRKTFMT
jgi:hypothetical protein